NQPTYNMFAGIRLVGRLNVTALERSLNEITRRHEALRTTFSVRDEQPIQIIHPDRELKLSAVDLQDLPEAQRLVAAHRRAVGPGAGRCALTRGSFARGTLLRLGAPDAVLLRAMHRMITDECFISRVLFKALQPLSDAFVAGKPSPLPPLS